jgi:hypothetical protein
LRSNFSWRDFAQSGGDSLGKATVSAQHNLAADLIKRNGNIGGSKAKAENLSAPAVA